MDSKQLAELIGQYGVQVATTGELAPTKELANALASLQSQQEPEYKFTKDQAEHYWETRVGTEPPSHVEEFANCLLAQFAAQPALCDEQQAIAKRLLQAVYTVSMQAGVDVPEFVDYLTTQGGLVKMVLETGISKAAQPAPATSLDAEFKKWVTTVWRPDDGAELLKREWPKFAFAAYEAGFKLAIHPPQAAQPVAWMRHDHTMCITDDSKRQMENTDFGHWKEVAASYTIPLAFAASPLPQSALSTDAQKVREQALSEAISIVREARDAIGAGALAENAQHERGIVGPYLDGIEDEIRALQSQSIPSAERDAEDLLPEARRRISDALPEDEPDCVPDWVCKLLINLGMGK